MHPLILSALAVGAVSLISILGLAALSLRKELLQRILFLLISLAAGALLGPARRSIQVQAGPPPGSP